MQVKMRSTVVGTPLIFFLLTLRYFVVIPNAEIQEGGTSQCKTRVHSYLRVVLSLRSSKSRLTLG